jgi:hypothetical protein
MYPNAQGEIGCFIEKYFNSIGAGVAIFQAYSFEQSFYPCGCRYLFLGVGRYRISFTVGEAGVGQRLRKLTIVREEDKPFTFLVKPSDGVYRWVRRHEAGNYLSTPLLRATGNNPTRFVEQIRHALNIQEGDSVNDNRRTLWHSSAELADYGTINLYFAS